MSSKGIKVKRLPGKFTPSRIRAVRKAENEDIYPSEKKIIPDLNTILKEKYKAEDHIRDVPHDFEAFPEDQMARPETRILFRPNKNQVQGLDRTTNRRQIDMMAGENGYKPITPPKRYEPKNSDPDELHAGYRLDLHVPVEFHPEVAQKNNFNDSYQRDVEIKHMHDQEIAILESENVEHRPNIDKEDRSFDRARNPGIRVSEFRLEIDNSGEEQAIYNARSRINPNHQPLHGEARRDPSNNVSKLQRDDHDRSKEYYRDDGQKYADLQDGYGGVNPDALLEVRDESMGQRGGWIETQNDYDEDAGLIWDVLTETYLPQNSQFRPGPDKRQGEYDEDAGIYLEQEAEIYDQENVRFHSGVDKRQGEYDEDAGVYFEQDAKIYDQENVRFHSGVDKRQGEYDEDAGVYIERNAEIYDQDNARFHSGVDKRQGEYDEDAGVYIERNAEIYDQDNARFRANIDKRQGEYDEDAKVYIEGNAEIYDQDNVTHSTNKDIYPRQESEVMPFQNQYSDGYNLEISNARDAHHPSRRQIEKRYEWDGGDQRRAETWNEGTVEPYYNEQTSDVHRRRTKQQNDGTYGRSARKTTEYEESVEFDPKTLSYRHVKTQKNADRERFGDRTDYRERLENGDNANLASNTRSKRDDRGNFRNANYQEKNTVRVNPWDRGAPANFKTPKMDIVNAGIAHEDYQSRLIDSNPDIGVRRSVKNQSQTNIRLHRVNNTEYIIPRTEMEYFDQPDHNNREVDLKIPTLINGTYGDGNMADVNIVSTNRPKKKQSEPRDILAIPNVQVVDQKDAKSGTKQRKKKPQQNDTKKVKAAVARKAKLKKKQK